MLQKMFTIYDDKAKAFLTPFFLPESGMAIRAFRDCINSADHQFGKNPEDYTLFTVGEFSDEDASVEDHPPKSLGNGVQFITTETDPEPDNETKISNVTPVQSGT